MTDFEVRAQMGGRHDMALSLLDQICLRMDGLRVEREFEPRPELSITPSLEPKSAQVASHAANAGANVEDGAYCFGGSLWYAALLAETWTGHLDVVTDRPFFTRKLLKDLGRSSSLGILTEDGIRINIRDAGLSEVLSVGATHAMRSPLALVSDEAIRRVSKCDIPVARPGLILLTELDLDEDDPRFKELLALGASRVIRVLVYRGVERVLRSIPPSLFDLAFERIELHFGRHANRTASALRRFGGRTCKNLTQTEIRGMGRRLLACEDALRVS